jgi:hypothetical protein
MLIPKLRLFSSLLPMCPGAFNDGCVSHPMDERLQRKGILAAFAARAAYTKSAEAVRIQPVGRPRRSALR